MSSMFCTKIYRCKNADWCARDLNPKSDNPKCFEAMTNGDRIRAMTDEQIATIANSFPCPPELPSGRCRSDCIPCWLDWLREEVNDDD